MIQREVLGPRDKYERTGERYLRDVRPFSARLAEGLASQASGFLLFAAAGVMALVPATVDLLVPASLAYAGWVLTRKVKLPMRLPKSAAMPDWNHPAPGSRKPRMASGTIYLGRDLFTGQEIWESAEDGRQHGTIPGTTGAGKTAAILSFLSNALTHGSGFVLVDGKADNKLFGEVSALARRFGREDDVLVLNFLVASGAKDSNTFNPFATGNADTIRELLASQLGEQRQDDPNGVFRARAIALIGTLAPVLTWMRDHKGVTLNIERIRFALELRGIWKIATQRLFEARDPETGHVTDIAVPDIPEDLIYPIQAYLGEIPGYDPTLAFDKQTSDKPREQHGYAVFYFTSTFAQLAGSLGHIFKVEAGDIVMRDVILNRRILVCNLPALENSDDTLAALGKLIMASVRGMMAEILGARLEGEFEQIVANKPGMGDAPYPIVFDEVAYYVGSGLDRMLAMGRGLNIMFWLAFQELSGVWARIGEKTASLLGNANLTVAMRQQDADRTRKWLEQTAGQAQVAQVSSYQGGKIGEYREARHADLRTVSRVDWADLQRLIEGEAILLFGGRRIYATLFHAEVHTAGPMRLNRPLMLAKPDATNTGDLVRVRQASAALRNSLVAGHGGDGPSGTLATMIEAMRAADAGEATEACLEAALLAVARMPCRPQEEDALDEATAVETQFTPMLDAALDPHSGDWGDAGSPDDPVDEHILGMLRTIEELRGIAPAEARRNALAALAERDSATATLDGRQPPTLPPSELRKLLQRLSELVAWADSRESHGGGGEGSETNG